VVVVGLSHWSSETGRFLGLVSDLMHAVVRSHIMKRWMSRFFRYRHNFIRDYRTKINMHLLFILFSTVEKDEQPCGL
jgi:hypothetical protein